MHCTGMKSSRVVFGGAIPPALSATGVASTLRVPPLAVLGVALYYTWLPIVHLYFLNGQDKMLSFPVKVKKIGGAER